jgi:alanine racemase
MPRPIRATIDLAAFRHNYRLARSLAGQRSIALAVIKANAYGHGLLPCAGAIADLAHGYALLELEEAARLREAGCTQPILLLEGFFHPQDLAPLRELGLTPVVHSPEQVKMLAGLPAGEAPLAVFLKVNTGMNRLGFPVDRVPAALERLKGLPAVGEVVLMTHFADADGEAGIAEQLARFAPLRDLLAGRVSVANSATLLRFPDQAGDVARPGIMLYGASPMPARKSAAELGLRPVMTLESEIIAVQSLAAGETVGYGATFTAERPLRVGVAACGYADGYPRHAPTGTPVLVAGQRTRTLGRVSMDMLACDLTDLPEAGVGSPVVLWGGGLPADEVAAAAGTISYELFCALAPRVPVRWIGIREQI